MAHTYPPVAFPPPPPTSNALSSHERAALIRSSKKLGKVLGDVPRVLDDISAIPSGPELTRTTTGTSITEAAWRKRKPTHIPPIPILKFATSEPTVASESPSRSSVYHRPPSCRSSVLSVLSDAPSIVSNAPLIGPDALSNSQRRSKLERLRRKLGDEVPITAVFPTTLPTAVPLPSPSPLPPTPKTSTSRSRSHTRSVHHRPDDARSLTFSISSDESVHTVTFTTTHVRAHSPHPSKTQAKNVYHTGALPPVPPIPTHLVSGSKSTSRFDDDHDDAGFIRPRQKMGAGSKFGGFDFKAARRAKREGRPLNGGMAAPGEMVEMVGFL
ncbi:hypothetical protein JVU11DRAFT_4526 [Chiua virens]|nr:hypothetical protein JVU11DRAFT_4526 [Chiua virens]